MQRQGTSGRGRSGQSEGRGSGSRRRGTPMVALLNGAKQAAAGSCGRSRGRHRARSRAEDDGGLGASSRRRGVMQGRQTRRRGRLGLQGREDDNNNAVGKQGRPWRGACLLQFPEEDREQMREGTRGRREREPGQRSLRRRRWRCPGPSWSRSSEAGGLGL